MTVRVSAAAEAGKAGKAATPGPGVAAPTAGTAGTRRETLKLLLLGGIGATAAAAATSAGFYLAGSQPGSGGASVDPDERLITWAASSIDQNPVDTRPVLIDEFERAHPTIEVTLLPGPSNTDAKRAELTAAIEEKADAPDVYLGDIIWPAEFGYAKLAMPLDDLFPDPSFWARFDDPLVAAGSFDGRKYSVPFYANQGVLFYRSDLLARYGKPVPKTWNELEATAEEIGRHPDAPPYGFIWQGDAYEGLTCVWMEFLADAGGVSVDPTAIRSIVDSPGAIEALTFLRRLIDKRITPDFVTKYQEPHATELFNDGQVVFMRGWNTADAGIEIGRERVGVAQLPTFRGKPSGGYSTIGGWSLFVNPHTHTRKLGAVKTFIEWMTGEQAQGVLARHAQIPTNKNVRHDRRVAPGNAVLRAALDARPVARPASTSLYPKISAAVYRNINLALAGKVEPVSALDAARKEIDDILA